MSERTTGVGSEGYELEQLQDLSETQPDLFHLLLEVKNYAGVAVMMMLLTLILTSGAFAADQNTNDDLGLQDNPHALVTPTVQFHEYLPLVERRLNSNDHATPTFAPPNPTAPTSTTATPNPFTPTLTSTTRATNSVTVTPTPTNTRLSTSTSTPSPTSTARPTITLTPSPSATVERPTITPTATAEPTPTQLAQWLIRSVDVMTEAKDRVCNQRDRAVIAQEILRIKNLGATHVGLATPYDSPNCDDSGRNFSLEYTRAWVNEIRAKNLKVWHRHMPLKFEGIYDMTKDPNADYIGMIVQYIHDNQDLFQEGDTFTFIPEPQNGGINGVTYCPQNICIFRDRNHFNQFLRDGITRVRAAFEAIPRLRGNKIQIACCGFDGFVTWGAHNPDHHGTSKLDVHTVEIITTENGILTIDHYPPQGASWDDELGDFEAVWHDTRVGIEEWGTIEGGNTVDSVNAAYSAFRRHRILINQYWQLRGGREGLVNDDATLSLREHYQTLADYFSGRR